MSQSEDRVRTTIDDHVATVRLVRGDKHNGLDWPMFVALGEAVTELREAPGVRAVVLCGEGPSFCAGLDFKSFGAQGVDDEDLLGHRDADGANLAQRVAYGWQCLPVPVIAALQGVCFGGGFQIAMGADIRFAAPDTRMSVMEIRYGLIPDMAISRTLPGLLRVDVAKELTFTGRIVEADEALALGLVTRIVDDPLAAAQELAAEIASKSPHAIRSGKRLLEEAYGPVTEGLLSLESELQAELLGSPNQLASVNAALNGEAAQFEDPESAAVPAHR